MSQSRLCEASRRNLVKLGKLVNCGRKSAFFKRNKSIIALTAQAGAYSSSAYAAISKIIALQAILAKG